MTGAEAKTLIYGLLGEQGGSAYYSPAQIEHWMRETMNDIAERTRYLLHNTDSSVAASTAVTLDADLIQVRRFETDNDGVMSPTTTRELWRNNRQWRSLLATAPRFYYMDTYRISSGAQALYLYPANSATTEYRLYFTSYPHDFIDGAVVDIDDNLEIPTWCAHAVVYGALAKAYLVDGHRMSAGASRFYGSMYDTLVDRLHVRANSRAPKIRVCGRPNRKRIRLIERLPEHIT